MPKKIQILDAVPDLATAPIFYCSTHGQYIFDPVNRVSTEFTVPANTIIIETTPIQYLCFFTNVLDVIEPLLTDRRSFLKYLDGQSNKKDKNKGNLKHKIVEALSDFIIYLPGSRIVNRQLTIGAGRRSGAGGTISERTRFDKMRFTKFYPNNELPPKEILKSTRMYLMDKPYENFETYESILQSLDRDPDGEPGAFRIVIFPCCGDVYEQEKYQEEIKHVERLQQTSRLKWMSMQTATLNSRMLNHIKWPNSSAVAAAAALSSETALFAPERQASSLGYGEYSVGQEDLNTLLKGRSGPFLRSEIVKDPIKEAMTAVKSLPHGIKQVFMKSYVGGAGGGYVNYKLVGNLTKAEINARLETGEELYEYVNGDPTRLTLMHGGAIHKTRRRNKLKGKKTKRYSIFK